jgi:hypothetical protein
MRFTSTVSVLAILAVAGVIGIGKSTPSQTSTTPTCTQAAQTAFDLVMDNQISLKGLRNLIGVDLMHFKDVSTEGLYGNRTTCSFTFYPDFTQEKIKREMESPYTTATALGILQARLSPVRIFYEVQMADNGQYFVTLNQFAR